MPLQDGLWIIIKAVDNCIQPIETQEAVIIAYTNTLRPCRNVLPAQEGRLTFSFGFLSQSPALVFILSFISFRFGVFLPLVFSILSSMNMLDSLFLEILELESCKLRQDLQITFSLVELMEQ